MSYAVGSTNLDLIVRAQRREPDAWDMLVDLYGPWIYNAGRRLGLSAEDAADATQETLLAVHRSFDQFKTDDPRSTFRGWLWTVLRSKVLDQQRRLAGQQRVFDAAALEAQVPTVPPDETTDALARGEGAALLARALLQVETEFEPRSWRAFWMVVVEGRSTVDVAAEMGLSTMAVRQAKCRVLKRLRQCVGDDPGGTQDA